MKLRTKWQKHLSYSVLTILILFPITVVFADDDDTIRGTLYFDNINDPPIFTDRWVTEQLVPPNTDITFYAEIYDGDNTSAQLNVSLYYSTDGFGANNISAIMPYVSDVEANIYRYEYLIYGRPAGTYMNYYYQVNDSANIVKEPIAPDTFSVQWSYPEIRIPSPDDYEPEPIVPTLNVAFVAVFFMLIFPAVFLALAFNGTKSRT